MKTIYITQTQFKISAVSSPLMHSIAKDVLVDQNETFSASEVSIQHDFEIDMSYKHNRISGSFLYGYNENEYLEFEGGISYDEDDGGKIRWIKFTDADRKEITLSSFNEKPVIDMLEIYLNDNYRVEMHEYSETLNEDYHTDYLVDDEMENN